MRKHTTNRLAGALECGEIRALGLVDWGRHCDDEEVAVTELIALGREGHAFGEPELLLRHLLGAVDALGQIADAPLVDVEANHRKMLRHVDSQRQAHVAKANDSDAHTFQRQQGVVVKHLNYL